MLSLVAAGVGATSAMAGVTTINFNTDPAATTPPLFVELGNGAAGWRASGGASGAANDGYLAINDARGGQQATLVFRDVDNGLVVKAFKFEADLRIGGGTANPADGFSINYVRIGDPLLANADAGIDPAFQNFAGAGTEASLPEEGSRTGLGIGFDTWQSGDAGAGHPGGITDVVGISVRVDGVLITQFPVPLRPGNTFPGGTYDPVPFRNLPASDANYPASMQTGALTTDEDLNGDGVVDAADVGVAQPAFETTDPATFGLWLKNLRWEKFVAELTEDLKVKLSWKGVELTPAGGLTVEYGPSSGRIVLAARTGGAWEAHHIDNIVLTTIASDRVVIGAVTDSPIGFNIGMEDSGASVLNPGSIQLRLNGVALDPAKVTTTKTGAASTISFRDLANPLPVGSTNTVELVARDTQNVEITGTRTFVVQPYMTVPAAMAVTGVNTAQPGFVMTVHQTAAGGFPNNVLRAERQLRGDLGANVATVSTVNVEGTVNFAQQAFGAFEPDVAGNFTINNAFPDVAIPGIPGATTDPATETDNIAAELLTYLEFDQPGVYTLIFNSDDGFRTSMAKNRREQLNNMLLSQFDGGRGASDTPVTLVVPTPGFYPVRSVWFEGGGGANFEWVIIRDGRPRALINDVGNANSIRAFRSASEVVPAGVVFANPARQTGNPYLANEAINVDIADPSNGTVTANSIVLTFNGATVTPTANKSGSITRLSYQPPAALASGSTNTVAVSFADSTGGNYTGTYTYTVATYATMPLSFRMPDSAVDKTKTGFLFKPVQAAIGVETRVRRAEHHVAGLLGLPNIADLTLARADGYFEIPGVINFDQAAGNAGVFTTTTGFPEENIPGVPGLLPDGVTTSTDNISAEILTVVEFPTAGLYTFSFNSDDGFATWFGHPNDAGRVFAGQFDGDRGASDTFYSVLVPQAGLYPVRSVWFEGGGGANLEWYTRINGVNALLNDTANGGLRTYQYPLGVGPTWVKTFVPANGANRVSLTDPIRAVIVDGTGVLNPATVSMMLNGAAVTPTLVKTGNETTVSYTPALVAGSTNTVVLMYGDRTLTRTFTAGTLDKVAFFIEAEDFNFGSGQSDAAASDMANYRGGAYAGRAAVAGVDYQRGSVGDSALYRIGEDPQVPMDVNYSEAWGRGFTDLQINYKIGWIGTNQWYNYTRTIPAGRYNVYAGLSHGEALAGQLSGTLQRVTAGATTANQTLEELGTFTGQGTGGWGVNRIVPLQVDGSNAVLEVTGGATTLRYSTTNGDFDFLLLTPAAVAPPEFTSVVLNPNGTITITWTGGGTLEASPSITGPFVPVAGAVSPYTITPDPAAPSLFGRIVR